MILDIIGGPNAADTEAIPDEAIRNYLRRLRPKPAKDLSTMYPSAGAQALDLLVNMLSFNPAGRISCVDALNHPFLQVQQEQEEQGPAVAAVVAQAQRLASPIREHNFNQHQHPSNHDRQQQQHQHPSSEAAANANANDNDSSETILRMILDEIASFRD